MKTNNIFQSSKAMIFKSLLASVVIIFTATSCDKDDDSGTTTPTTDTSAPVIVLSSPDTGVTFHSGDTIHLLGDITDNDGIHEVGMAVLNDKGLPEMHKMEHTHGLTYHIDEKYVIPTTMHTNFTVRVRAEDHNGNEAMVTRLYHVHM